MKLSSKKISLDTFEKKVDDAIFFIKPLTHDLYSVATAFVVFQQTSKILSDTQKRFFVQDFIADWSGVLDDDGASMEASDENKAILLSEEYESLLTTLIIASWSKKKDMLDKVEEDKEAAKK